jgi:hypothetical protein
MDYIKQKYEELCRTQSDINEHLPTLYEYANKCESVIELGVRGCVASWAITYGLLTNNESTRRFLMNYIVECDINELLSKTKDLEITMDYKWINDLDMEVNEEVDLTFIDTWHIYGQLKRELEKYSKLTKKYIIMHDTTVDEIYGETLRSGWNSEEQSRQSGFPVEEINCGLGKAVDEFLLSNKEWVLKEKFTNNNGLTILERVSS